MSNECEGCDRWDCRQGGCIGDFDVKKEGVFDGEFGMAVTEVDIVTLRYLVSALQALQDASRATSNGFASDYCDNAADQIRKAMRTVGG